MMVATRHPQLGTIGAVVLAGLGGCAESNFNDKAPSAPIDATQTDAGASQTSADTGLDGPNEPQAAFYGLSLGFEVLGGEIVDGSAALTVALWSDANPPTAVCNHDVPVRAATAAEIPVLESLQVDEETGAGGLLGWWELDLGAGVADDPRCPPWEERIWSFGLGPYDPRLDAAADAAGLLGTELFGLYLREQDDPAVFVVGVAGTAEMFAGGYGPDPSGPPPLPDGAYLAESLLLMDLW